MEIKLVIFFSDQLSAPQAPPRNFISNPGPIYALWHCTWYHSYYLNYMHVQLCIRNVRRSHMYIMFPITREKYYSTILGWNNYRQRQKELEKWEKWHREHVHSAKIGTRHWGTDWRLTTQWKTWHSPTLCAQTLRHDLLVICRDVLDELALDSRNKTQSEIGHMALWPVGDPIRNAPHPFSFGDIFPKGCLTLQTSRIVW